AVAILAAALGGWVLRLRAVTFREKVIIYDRCEKSCDWIRTQIADNLRVIEENRGGGAEIQAAKNLEGLLLVRISSRGEEVTSENMARRFVRIVAPERLATLRK